MNETIFERHFAALSISSWIILAYRHSSLETYPAPAWGWMRPDGTAGFVVCLLAPEMNGSHLLAAPKNGMVSSPKVGLKPTKVIKQRKLLRVHNIYIYNIIYVCICIYIYIHIYIYTWVADKIICSSQLPRAKLDRPLSVVKIFALW